MIAAPIFFPEHHGKPTSHIKQKQIFSNIYKTEKYSKG